MLPPRSMRIMPPKPEPPLSSVVVGASVIRTPMTPPLEEKISRLRRPRFCEACFVISLSAP